MKINGGIGEFTAVVVSYLLFICGQVYAEQRVISYENNIATTSSLSSGVEVVVKPLDTRSIDSGVSDKTIRTKVELLLRGHGVLVKEQSNTQLEITTNAVKAGGQNYAGYIRVEYKEKTANNKYTITLWFKEVLLAYEAADEIYKSIAETTEVFLNDLLKTRQVTQTGKKSDVGFLRGIAELLRR